MAMTEEREYVYVQEKPSHLHKTPIVAIKHSVTAFQSNIRLRLEESDVLLFHLFFCFFLYKITLHFETVRQWNKYLNRTLICILSWILSNFSLLIFIQNIPSQHWHTRTLLNEYLCVWINTSEFRNGARQSLIESDIDKRERKKGKSYPLERKYAAIGAITMPIANIRTIF